MERQIRTGNRQKYRIKHELDILPNEWSVQEGLAIGKSEEAASINKQIENHKTELNKHYNAIVESKDYITTESLKNVLRGIGTNRNTLTQEFAQLVEEKHKVSKSMNQPILYILMLTSI